MKSVLLASLSVAAVVVSSAATAVDADALLACRKLAVDSERLACYDKALDSQTMIASGEVASPPVVPSASNAPVPTPRPMQSAADFGLENQIARETKIEAIVSRIPGEFRGWEANSRITLENGQVWQIADKSRGVYILNNPVVTIERGALGSFNLRIEGANRAPKVRRLK